MDLEKNQNLRYFSKDFEQLIGFSRSKPEKHLPQTK